MSLDSDHPMDQQLLERGRREGFATAALILSLVSFVNLLGAEKSILALVLAAFALRGVSSQVARKRGWIAVVIACLHVITILVVLTLLRDRLSEVLQLLQKLG